MQRYRNKCRWGHAVGLVLTAWPIFSLTRSARQKGDLKNSQIVI